MAHNVLCGANGWSSRFVSGHGFSRAERRSKKELASAPVMARPARNASGDSVLNPARVFFATTKTSMGRRLFQSERNASLFISVLRSYVAARKFTLHDFVVMPDHVHLLMTVPGDMTIEKAMQLIKGGFSFRLKRECGYLGEVWQHGFSEVRADDQQDFLRYRRYIANNPVKVGLVESPDEYPYCYGFLAKMKEAGVKTPASSLPIRHG